MFWEYLNNFVWAFFAGSLGPMVRKHGTDYIGIHGVLESCKLEWENQYQKADVFLAVTIKILKTDEVLN